MFPKVSVFLPTYQHVPFIRDAIENVLVQDYPNLEIIVGDDGSTDGTREIVLEYQNRFPRLFRLILSEVNTGATENQNRVYAACTGEYIIFHSGDDLWLPGKLHKQVAWFDANADAVLCYTNVEHFDSNSGRRIGLLHGKDHPFRSGGVEVVLAALTTFNGLTVMARRSACPKRGYDSRLKYVSDWLFWVETAKNGRIGFIPEVLARYRIHPNNLSKRAEVMISEQLLCLGIIEAQYADLIHLTRNLRTEVLLSAALRYLKVEKYELAKLYFHAGFIHGPFGVSYLPFAKKWLVYAMFLLNELPLLLRLSRLRK